MLKDWIEEGADRLASGELDSGDEPSGAAVSRTWWAVTSVLAGYIFIVAC